MANWRDDLELPEDLKTSTNLAKYETLEAALRGGEEMSTRLGRSITIPSEEAGEDAWKAYTEKLQTSAKGKLVLHPDHGEGDHAHEFWKMAGVPEDPKDYLAPEEVSGMSDEQVEEIRKLATESGWTKKQFKATIAQLDQQALTQSQQFEELQAGDQAIITGKLGLAKDEKIAGILALAPQFADPDHPPAWIAKPELLTAGDILWLNNVAAAFSGKGPQVKVQPNAGDNQMTPGEIRQQQTDIRTRLTKEQYTMDRGEYKRLIKKLETLGRMAAA